MKQRVFNILISLAVLGLGILQYLDHTSNKDGPKEDFTDIEVIEVEPAFFTKSPEEGLMEALEYYGVQHPKIVYAQAVLETGHFKSDLCINSNNLFGLYNSKEGKYYYFNHWSDAILGYITMVEYKYKGGDYYEFLRNLPYATDEKYIDKIKAIENNLPP